MSDAKSAGLARRLREAGAPAGRPIVAATGSAELLALLLEAAPGAGCPLFPLDPTLPAEVRAGLAERAGAGFVVGEEAIGALPGLTPAELRAAPDAPLAPKRLGPSEIRLIVATSGSDGWPKAAMLTGANLRASARATCRRIPLGRADVWLACLPLFHIGGLSIPLRAREAGARAVLHDRFAPERVLDALAHEGVTHLSLVPTMLSKLLEAGGDAPPPPSLRHVRVGGAALGSGLAARARAAGWPIRPSYGMSETASQFATLAAVPDPWPPGLVGLPLPGGEAALAPDGRLKVRGPMVMAGYANPALRPGDGLDREGWFTTSDLAAIGDTGQLTILGRADWVIVSGGEKVDPAGIEDVLTSCPGVTVAAALGRPDPLWGESVVAFYGGGAAPDAVMAWCRERLRPAARPKIVQHLEVFPLLTSGKPDRAALKRAAGLPARPPAAG